MEAGRIAQVGVRVRNASPAPWPDDRCVHLGDHWRDHGGAVVLQDDGRTALARTLEPGDTVDLTLDVEAPLATGEYVLELDLVIDSVAWFADKGSPTATIKVDVVARTGADANDAPATRPVMETHGIRRANVEAILLAGAVDVSAVRETNRSDGWCDLWYVGTKRESPAAKPRRRLRELFRRR
jgi:hypothetical protein